MSIHSLFYQVAGARSFSSLKRKKSKRKKRTMKRKKRTMQRKKRTMQRKKRTMQQKKKKSSKTLTLPKSRTKQRDCFCDNKKTYKGTEPSPKGLGYCAHCTPLNVTMKGRDGNLWKNMKFRNSRKWFKVRQDMIGGFLRPGTF